VPFPIGAKADAGKTLYAIVWDATDATVLDASLTPVAYLADNWTQYAKPLVDIDSNGYYSTSLEISKPGIYLVDLYEQAGATPNRLADTEKSSGLISYDGTTEITNLEIYLLLKQIAAGGIILPSVPVVHNVITIFAGDSYEASENRALEWSTLEEGDWPDLTGATVEWWATKEAENEASGIAEYRKPVTVLQATGKYKRLQIELTAAETRAFAVWTHGYSYRVYATLANGNRVTLVSGTMTVR
jgi:hypothetical protein